MRCSLPTKVAHDKVCEKVAMLIGCRVAFWADGLEQRSRQGEALALVLLEAVSDVTKAAAKRWPCESDAESHCGRTG